jgi:hypothetical protein
MRFSKSLASVSFVLLAVSASAERVLFEDSFEKGLSPKWRAAGLAKSDYRFRGKGLEMRVQPGKFTKDTPMLKLNYPFKVTGTTVVSVKVSLLNEFSADHEFAGVFLLTKNGPDFRGTKEQIEGKLVFAPGTYRFIGKPGEEDNPKKQRVEYSPATQKHGPLRITVDRGDAFFQVGPSADKQKMLGFFNSEIDSGADWRGYCLAAAGAPKNSSHWVRFEEFRVLKP